MYGGMGDGTCLYCVDAPVVDPLGATVLTEPWLVHITHCLGRLLCRTSSEWSVSTFDVPSRRCSVAVERSACVAQRRQVVARACTRLSATHL